METSRPAFSLRWKILAWFFVNLLVLGGILFFFLRVQFRVGINSLLAGPTSDRLEAIAKPLVTELRGEPLESWEASLDRAAAVWRERGLSVSLYRGNGSYLVGDIHDAPAEVTEIIQQHERRNHGPLPPRNGGPHRHGPHEPDDDSDHRPPGGATGPDPGDFGRMMGPPPDDEPDHAHGPRDNRDRFNAPPPRRISRPGSTCIRGYRPAG